MKRWWLIFIAFLIIIPAFISCAQPTPTPTPSPIPRPAPIPAPTPTPTPTVTGEEAQFQLTEWRVTDDDGAPALLTTFTNPRGISLTLTDPHGLETYSRYFFEGTTGAKLHLAGYEETPEAGQYTLVVQEGIRGEIIATQYFDFQGAEATISEVLFTWTYWAPGYYRLENIRFEIDNGGDLPAYIDKGKLIIAGKEDSLDSINEVVLPGVEKTISIPAFVADITPGEHTAILELKDGADKVVCSYSCAVTPAVVEKTEFHLTGSEVTDWMGRPRLRLGFTILGDVAYLFLTNPNGVQTASNRIYKGMTEVTLNLAGSYEIPDAGIYTVTARDALGEIVAELDFEFEGAEATISQVELIWDYSEVFKYYFLEGISFKVSNDGDLPAYVYEAIITINGERCTIDVSPYQAVLLSGEESTFDESPILSGIKPGEKLLTLELKDATGKVAGSYTSNIIPTE